jgi:lysophospholipid acyltransferase (LPLAT)-like uncharacterized protein
MMAEALPDTSRPRPASGGTRLVRPHPLKWYQRLGATLIYAFIEGVAWTLRFEWQFPPGFLDRKDQPLILAVWHNRLPLSLILYRQYVRLKQRPHRMAAIVSASKDGGIVARILQHFGVQPVRGSSSRRGPQALLELTTWAERGYDLAITPDGPRGPCYVVQIGAVALAHLTGQPIVPASYHLGWKIRLNSWDRFQIPLPFSRVIINVGQPIEIPRDASDSELQALRLQLEERMRSLTLD